MKPKRLENPPTQLAPLVGEDPTEEELAELWERSRDEWVDPDRERDEGGGPTPT